MKPWKLYFRWIIYVRLLYSRYLSKGPCFAPPPLLALPAFFIFDGRPYLRVGSHDAVYIMYRTDTLLHMYNLVMALIKIADDVISTTVDWGGGGGGGV
jgi:hypothetical protein